ncbi:MAG: GNAT family N-acetyltransferase [Dehalococcoidales bacterium]|nr:GNAT family N-acetyltransferase [Dehalococcoidales bacterium]
MSIFTCELVSDDQLLAEALKVRREVFVNERGISEEEEYDGYDEQALHVVIKDDRDRVIGTARVRFLDNHRAKIERMAVLKAFRRQGVGRLIIAFLGELLANRQIEYIILHAQLSAADFYKSCGFEEQGEIFEEAGISHIQMWKRL